MTTYMTLAFRAVKWWVVELTNAISISQSSMPQPPPWPRNFTVSRTMTRKKVMVKSTVKEATSFCCGRGGMPHWRSPRRLATRLSLTVQVDCTHAATEAWYLLSAQRQAVSVGSQVVAPLPSTVMVQFTYGGRRGSG